MDSIGMLLVVLVVGVLLGVAGYFFFDKKKGGTVATDTKLQAYVDCVQRPLQAQVNELKTKLLPTDVQDKLKDVGDGLWETFKAKVLADLAELKDHGLAHIASIDSVAQRVENFTKEELVKLHLEKEAQSPASEPVVVGSDPVLTVSPADPQTVVSSAPATPVVDDQNKTV